jgi:hypothetical protein
MRVHGVVFAIAIACAASSAKAELSTVANSGIWSTVGGEVNGIKVCEVLGSVDFLAEGIQHSEILSLEAMSNNPHYVRLNLQNGAYNFRDGSRLTIDIRFDGGVSEELSAISRGPVISTDMGSAQLIPWMHGFTAGRNMTVSVQGDASHFLSFSLVGTTTAINAMSDCTKLAGFMELPRPFTPPDAALTTPQTQMAFTASPAPTGPSSPELPNTAHAPQSALEPIIAEWGGSGMMTTRPFHVDGPWELQWQSNGLFVVKLFDGNGNYDLIASESEPGTSRSYVPNGGNYYIKITASGGWKMKAVSLSGEQQSTGDAPEPPPAAVPPQIAVPPAHEAVRLPQSDSVAPATSNSALPPAEVALIDAVKGAIAQYQNGQTEMQKGASRPMRAQAICRALPGRRAQNWIGTISNIDTNGEGKGVLVIQIADGITVETWNNSLSDVMDHTLIEATSSVFTSALQLKQGQRVRFSGTFLPSETDCIEERSLSLRGSVTEPAFILRFEAISP